jgi:hypothetical protein
MSKKYPALLEQLLEGVSLSEGEAHGLMHEMAGGEMEPALAADTIDSGKAAKFLGNFRTHFAA